MRTLTLSLSEDLGQFIDAEVASKGFSDVSDYIGYLLLDELKREGDPQLEALLLEGLKSDSIVMDEEYWKRLKEKTDAIAEKDAAQKK